MTGPDFGPEPSKQGKVLIELLKDRPHAWGAEIGVNHGETQCHLLRHLPHLERLYAVDPWLAYPGYRKSLSKAKFRDQRTFSTAWGNYLKRIGPWAEKVFILRCFSYEAAEVIRDQRLDFVFIDANHSYPHVTTDIELWTPKVKRGGIIAGHDYFKRPEWGVIRAVDDAFGDRVHTEPHTVWWVEKT